MTDQREDFEETAARMGYNLTMAEHETGEYHYPVTQDAWNMWQECCDKAACAQGDSEPAAKEDSPVYIRVSQKIDEPGEDFVEIETADGISVFIGSQANGHDRLIGPLYERNILCSCPPAAKVPDWTNRLNTCKHHGDDHEACAVYGGRVPCDAEGGEAVGVVTFEGTVEWFPGAKVHAGMEVYIAPQPDKWIPVSERLPESEFVTVMACQGRNEIIRTANFKESQWKTGPSSMDYLAEVTHWMPLPAPPDQESE